MWGRLKKMVQSNLYTKQKETHRRRKQNYGQQRGKEGMINLECWINRSTLSHIKQIKKQGSIAQNRELYTMFFNNL